MKKKKNRERTKQNESKTHFKSKHEGTFENVLFSFFPKWQHEHAILQRKSTLNRTHTHTHTLKHPQNKYTQTHTRSGLPSPAVIYITR